MLRSWRLLWPLTALKPPVLRTLALQAPRGLRHVSSSSPPPPPPVVTDPKKEPFDEVMDMLKASVNTEERGIPLPWAGHGVTDRLASLVAESSLLSPDTLLDLGTQVKGLPSTHATLDASFNLLSLHRLSKNRPPPWLFRSILDIRQALHSDARVDTRWTALAQDTIIKDQVKLWRFAHEIRRDLGREISPSSFLRALESRVNTSSWKPLLLLLTQIAPSRLGDQWVGKLFIHARNDASLVRWVQNAIALHDGLIEGAKGVTYLHPPPELGILAPLYLDPAPLDRAITYWDRLMLEGRGVYTHEGRALVRSLRLAGRIEDSDRVKASSPYLRPSDKWTMQRQWTIDLKDTINTHSEEKLRRLIEDANAHDIYPRRHAFAIILRNVHARHFDFINRLMDEVGVVPDAIIWDIRVNMYGLRGDAIGLRGALAATTSGSFPPDARLYASLIRGFGRLHLQEEIIQCMTNMQRQGLVPGEASLKIIREAESEADYAKLGK